MIFFDTETCGLCGPIVLLQYAVDDGPIEVVDLWDYNVDEATDILNRIIFHRDGVCGFNLAFDWFHVAQMYTTLDYLINKGFEHRKLSEIIEEYAIAEKAARDGPCVKPYKACDVMLHARKGPYQSTMDRKAIYVRRVPTQLAYPLLEELEKRVVLKNIYFARRKKWQASQWQIRDIEGTEDFKHLVLKFDPSTALKVLAMDALGVSKDEILKYSDIEVPKEYWPQELGYAPYALAVPDWQKVAWPAVIKHHIAHWKHYGLARKYASNDVLYTRELYKFFGSPLAGDDDSELSCMIGCSRWRGFKIDIDRLRQLREQAIARSTNIPTAPRAVRAYIGEKLSNAEKMIIAGSTNKKILRDLSGKKIDDLNGKLIQHPAAVRAQEVLDARLAKFEETLYDKLIQADRFHAEFKGVGTLSGRMAGGRDKAVESAGKKSKKDGLNPQGIPGRKDVRSCFPLAFDGYQLNGGDFDSFEVTIADAIYNDPKLRRDLLTCGDCGYVFTIEEYQSNQCPKCMKHDSRKKIHALFAQKLFPKATYEEICKSKRTSFDMYDMGKRGVFAVLYFGDQNTIKERIGIPIEDAEAAFQRFISTYKGVILARRRITDAFCSMRQPKGIGTQVEWYEPEEYVQSLLGFRRYFTLENRICKTLYLLATDPPKEWGRIKIKVQRRERFQTVSGAVRSALYGAAFQIQAAAMRAAGNHEIQSTGAGITKNVQRKIWDIQPSGVNQWLVQPMNVHDEIMCPTLPSIASLVRDVVDETVQSYRTIVPLIKMDWKDGLQDWSDK